MEIDLIAIAAMIEEVIGTAETIKIVTRETIVIDQEIETVVEMTATVIAMTVGATTATATVSGAETIATGETMQEAGEAAIGEVEPVLHGAVLAADPGHGLATATRASPASANAARDERTRSRAMYWACSASAAARCERTSRMS